MWDGAALHDRLGDCRMSGSDALMHRVEVGDRVTVVASVQAVGWAVRE